MKKLFLALAIVPALAQHSVAITNNTDKQLAVRIKVIITAKTADNEEVQRDGSIHVTLAAHQPVVTVAATDATKWIRSTTEKESADSTKGKKLFTVAILHDIHNPTITKVEVRKVKIIVPETTKEQRNPGNYLRYKMVKGDREKSSFVISNNDGQLSITAQK